MINFRGWYAFELEPSFSKTDKTGWTGVPWGCRDVVAIGDNVTEVVENLRESLVLYIRENHTDLRQDEILLSDDDIVNILTKEQSVNKLIVPVYVDPCEFVAEISRKDFEHMRDLCNNNGISIVEKLET